MKKKNTLTQKMMEINHEKIIIKMHSEIIKKDFFFKNPASPYPTRKMIYFRYKDNLLQRSNIFCLLKILFLSLEFIKLYKDKRNTGRHIHIT